MDSACFSTSLPRLPTVWSLPPGTATLLLSVSHFMFQSPVSGFPAPWPPVSPFASSHPCSLSGLWSPSTLCCPLGSLHRQPLPPTTFLLSSPFHPITLSLLSSPSPVHASVSPVLSTPLPVKILSLGRGLGRGGGWDRTKGEDFLDVVRTKKDGWKK